MPVGIGYSALRAIRTSPSRVVVMKRLLDKNSLPYDDEMIAHQKAICQGRKIVQNLGIKLDNSADIVAPRDVMPLDMANAIIRLGSMVEDCEFDPLKLGEFHKMRADLKRSIQTNPTLMAGLARVRESAVLIDKKLSPALKKISELPYYKNQLDELKAATKIAAAGKPDVMLFIGRYFKHSPQIAPQFGYIDYLLGLRRAK